MTLNPTLMALLACPSDDHAPLREERDAGTETLVCTFCATRYPVLDGIPVLLLDDATPGPNGVGVAAEPEPLPVPIDAVVAAEPQGPLSVDAFAGRVPFDPRLSPKHALPDTEAVAEAGDPADAAGSQEQTVQPHNEPAEPEAPVEIDAAPVELDSEPAELDSEPAELDSEPADLAAAPAESEARPAEAPTAEPAVEVEPEPDAEGEPRAAAPPRGRRARTAVLRDRVQQRLAELEATRGPRGSRRGGTG